MSLLSSVSPVGFDFIAFLAMVTAILQWAALIAFLFMVKHVIKISNKICNDKCDCCCKKSEQPEKNE